MAEQYVSLGDGFIAPTEDAPRDPTVWGTVVIGAIRDAVVPRLDAQEAQIGLKASLPINYELRAWPTPGPERLPFAVGGDAGGRYPDTREFEQGITLVDGIATIATRGIYHIVCSVGAEKGTGRTVAIGLMISGGLTISAESPTSADYYATAYMGSSFLLIPGDTVNVIGHSAGGTTPQPVAGDNTKTYLSISLVTPMPEPVGP